VSIHSEALRLAIRLRPQALTYAMRALAVAVARQSAAQSVQEAAGRDLIERRELATRSVSDSAVDEFAAWLPAGKRALDEAAHRLARETSAAAATRAALRLARSALSDCQAG